MRPRMVLMRPSSLRMAVTGREYHYAYCRLSPHWELPSGYSSLYLAPHRIEKHNRPEKKVKSRCLSYTAHPGAVAKVAYAHHNNNRNVFDEWVFGFQGTNPFIKR